MFIVEVDILGKHNINTFQDEEKVVGYYLDMCKTKIAEPTFNFHIDSIVKYCDCSLVHYELHYTNSGIVLLEEGKDIVEGGGESAEEGEEF